VSQHCLYAVQEKLTVAHISKKFHASDGTSTFSALLTTAVHITLPCLQKGQSPLSHNISLKSVVIFCHLWLFLSRPLLRYTHSQTVCCFSSFPWTLQAQSITLIRLQALKCLQTQFRFTIPVTSSPCLKNISHRPVPSTSLYGVPSLRAHNSNVHTKHSTCTHKLRSKLPHKTVLKKVT